MKAWVSGKGDLYSRKGVKTKVNRPVYTCAKYNGTLIMKPFSDELKAIVQEILQEQKPSDNSGKKELIPFSLRFGVMF